MKKTINAIQNIIFIVAFAFLSFAFISWYEGIVESITLEL